MYEKYVQYIKEYFLQHGGYYHPDPRYNFRSKYEHTLRVLRWCKMLIEDLPGVNEELLYMAAIFHDVGYGESLDKSLHAEKSSAIFAEYAKQQNIDSEIAEKVAYLIKMHSNKEMLKLSDTLPELVLLMEADLLDEEGALRVIWYCAAKAIQGADHYMDFYDFIQRGSANRRENPMVTPLAKEIWEQKIKLVEDFSEELLFDINTDVEIQNGGTSCYVTWLGMAKMMLQLGAVGVIMAWPHQG